MAVERDKFTASEAEARTQLTRARTSLMTAQLLRAGALWERDPVAGLALLTDTDACPPELRDFTWGLSYRLCRRDRRLAVPPSGMYSSATFSPDGRTLAAAVRLWAEGRKATSGLRLWDVETGRERLSLGGHAGEVTSVVFSPDGRTLASGGADRTVRLWDAASGKEKATLQGHRGEVTSVAFAPDGKTLASGSGDATIKLWNVDTGKEKLTLTGHGVGISPDAGVSAVAFTPDGTTVVSGSRDRTVRLWDAVTGKPRATLRGHDSPVLAVAVSPGGELLASGSMVGKVRVWDARTRQQIRLIQGHGNLLTSLAFAPDGKTLATGCADKIVRLWEPRSGQERLRFTGHSAPVWSVAFAPDGKTLAAACGGLGGRWNPLPGEVRLWAVSASPERLSWKAHPATVTALAVTANGKTVVSAGMDRVARIALPRGVRPAEPDRSLLLWEVPSGRRRATLREKGGSVLAAAFSPDGTVLATGGVATDKEDSPGELKLWDVASGKERGNLPGHAAAVCLVAFAADGKTLRSGDVSGVVKRWDTSGKLLSTRKVAATGRAPSPLPAKGSAPKADEPAFVSLALSADGRTLALAGWELVGTRIVGLVWLWDVPSWRQQMLLRVPVGTVVALAFAPDGRTLAGGIGVMDDSGLGETGAVKLWDRASGKERVTLKGHSLPVGAVTFSADGKTLASATHDDRGRPAEMKLWDAASGQERASLAVAGGGALLLVFSADGKRLAAGCLDGTIRVWEAGRP